MIQNEKRPPGGGTAGDSEEKLHAGAAYVRLAYALLAAIFFACIVIQTFLAGVALFADAGNWKLHTSFVAYFDKLPLAMFLLSFFGRIRGRLRWLPLAMFALTSLQYVTVEMLSNVGYAAAIHPVNALLLFWGSMFLMKRSWRWFNMKPIAV